LDLLARTRPPIAGPAPTRAAAGAGLPGRRRRPGAGGPRAAPGDAGSQPPAAVLRARGSLRPAALAAEDVGAGGLTSRVRAPAPWPTPASRLAYSCYSIRGTVGMLPPPPPAPER